MYYKTKSNQAKIRKPFQCLLLISIFLSSISLILAQSPSDSVMMWHNYIEAEQKVIENLKTNEPIDLPVGIGKMVNGKNYTIDINELVLSPDGSWMSAATVVKVPGSEDQIVFSTSALAITPSGIKGNSTARLNLLNNFSTRLSNKIKLTLKGDQRKTYIEFDCNGYLGMGVQGEFEFCREMVIPELPDGTEAPEPARVKATVEGQMYDWGSLIAKVNITPFQIAGLKGFGFYVKDAYVDQSEVSNPAGIVFPTNYESPDFTADGSNFWQGFFLKQVAVKLPAQFSNSASARKEIAATNIIIDNRGISGWIAAKNIIPFNEGNLSNWPFSIDSIAVQFTCNKLTGAGFRGKLTVPIAKTELNYTALIQDGNKYSFSISPTKTLEVPLWGATMNLLSTSSIEVNYINDKFIPIATLHGDINVTPDLGNGGDKAQFKGIRFENLVISSTKPYIKPGTFSIESSNSKMMAFSVTIKEIGIVTIEDKTGLHLGIAVNLMKDGDGGFAGMAAVDIMGKMEENNGRKKWVFSEVRLDKLSVDIDQGAYSIKGALVIYRKHPVFGSGFQGAVEIKVTPGLVVAAKAQFGSLPDYRYWYVDALVKLPTGTPIATGFALYGFGGGIYHHMKQKSFANASLTNAPASGGPVVTGTTIQDPAMPASKIEYIPDPKILLGLKATVIVGTFPSANAFNADVTFEIAFNEVGGLDMVGFLGNGYFMSEVGKGDNSAKVKASVNINYDFDNKILHGVFDVFVNVPGVLQGSQGGNLAGTTVLHFEGNKWYIHVGTPSSRIGLRIINTIEATSYLMVGTELEPMPPVPREVSDILGDLNFSRNESMMKSAGGFAFGSSITITTGKLQFLIFYGQFGAGAGFDIMLQKYVGVHCEGRSGDIGLNGWYASGQAYAYVKGEVGINVDLYFVSGQFKILEIGAAAVLQTKLPNPSYFEGNIGGYYSILCGKVKGHCKFKFQLGEQCKLSGGSVVSGMKIIGDVTPRAGDNNVSVFANPQAAFNLPINKPFELQDLDGQVKSFRVRLGSFKLLNNGVAVEGNVQFDQSNEVAAFQSADILPTEKSIKSAITIYFEELKNGSWQQVMVNGKIVEEMKELNFTTGKAPDYIPASNVAATYPVVNQYNFYKSEYPQGYIKLVKGQPDLFANDNKWQKVGKYVNAQGVFSSKIYYDNAQKLVQYDILPALQNQKVYTFSVLNVPASQATQAIDANVVRKEADKEQTYSEASKDINGAREVLQEKTLYSYAFRTSKYNSFLQKMNAWSITQGWSAPIDGYEGVHEIGTNISAEELLDKAELTENLIVTTAKMNNNWYSNKVYPLIYKPYPFNGIVINWRDTTAMGLPPSKAIGIRGINSQTLTEGEIVSGQANATGGYAQLVYSLPFYMYKDYENIIQQGANKYVGNNANEALTKIINTPFPDITSGKYEVEMKYQLPGIKKITSTYTLIIKNP